MHKSLLQRLKIFWLLLFMYGAGFTGVMAHAQDYDQNAAVIFAYQRIGEDLYPGNNLTVDQFRKHFEELTGGDYNVAALPDIVAALQTGQRLPDKTVAITFNGAYQSAFKNALPLLLDKNIPFTVFFSPDQADGKNPEYAGWGEIKRLRRNNNVTFGLHTSSYTRLTESPPAEIRRQVNNALTRYRAELKSEPKLFAYPFGEYTKEFRKIIQQAGFTAAFGQQSGVAYGGADMFALPRFAMTESYGDEDRFRMAALALPLPVRDIAPDDPHISTANPPTLGFTLDETLTGKISQLSCFISESGKPEIQVIGKNRIELRLTAPFQSDRIRLNCTMPGPSVKPGEEQRWRWFGLLMTMPQQDHFDDNGTPPDESGPYPN